MYHKSSTEANEIYLYISTANRFYAEASRTLIFIVM